MRLAVGLWFLDLLANLRDYIQFRQRSQRSRVSAFLVGKLGKEGGLRKKNVEFCGRKRSAEETHKAFASDSFWLGTDSQWSRESLLINWLDRIKHLLADHLPVDYVEIAAEDRLREDLKTD